jgi:hypothetical protein
MSPILGIYASQISGKLWEPAGGYDALWSTTLGTATSTITISNIPQDYKHLQIRGIGRTSASGTGRQIVRIQFNSDTGANYSFHDLYGNGTIAQSSAGTSTTYAYMAIIPNNGETANSFGASITDILDYANTNKNKTTRALTGADLNGSGVIDLTSGNWRNTAAISSITLTPDTGSFVQYSSFALYGVK